MTQREPEPSAPAATPVASPLGRSTLVVAVVSVGLTAVSDTTSPAYWTTALVTGLLLVVVTAGTRLRSLSLTALQIATSVAQPST